MIQSELKKNIEMAAEFISKMEKGTMITHICMADMLGVKYKTNVYYNAVRKLDNKLKQDYGIFIEINCKIGYEIKELGKEIDLQAKKCDKAVNSYKKAVSDMRYINIEAIKDQQKRERTIRIAQEKANILGLLKIGTAKQEALIS